MNNLDEIEAELTALGKNIELLDKEFHDGTLGDVFYFKRRIALVRDQELNIKKLRGILEQQNAPEVALVLDKVASGANEDEVGEELKNAEEAGKSKGWGEAFKNAVSEKKGSIIQVAISAALKVAKFLILA